LARQEVRGVQQVEQALVAILERLEVEVHAVEPVAEYLPDRGHHRLAGVGATQVDLARVRAQPGLHTHTRQSRVDRADRRSSARSGRRAGSSVPSFSNGPVWTNKSRTPVPYNRTTRASTSD
jgi:phytoene dehydrogenase-like protein